MNFEHVLELYQQAEAVADAHPTAPYEARIYSHVRMMAFADLIIKECIAVADANRTAMEMDRNAHLTADAIKEHFGVEE